MYILEDQKNDIFNFPREKIISKFDELLDISYIQTINSKIKYIPKRVRKEIESYKDVISKISLISPLNEGYQHQYFNLDVYWDNDFNITNNFIFYINTLDKLLKLNSSNDVKYLSVPNLYNLIYTSGFDKEPPSKSFGKPIYVSKFIPTNSMFVLDGNHRIYEAYNQNKKVIPTIYINEVQYFQCLLNDSFRILYLIYYNYQIFNRILYSRNLLDYHKLLKKIKSINEL